MLQRFAQKFIVGGCHLVGSDFPTNFSGVFFLGGGDGGLKGCL